MQAFPKTACYPIISGELYHPPLYHQIKQKTIMKSFNILKSILFGLLLLVSQVNAFAQTKKPTLTVLNIDTKGFSLDAVQMGNLVRLEMERLDKYDVTDKYDINYLIEKNQLNVNNCYGKICLVEIGEKVNSDFMFTGNVETYPGNTIFTFRLINVKEKTIEKTHVMEFLNFPEEIQSMVSIAIKKMYGLPVNEELLIHLTKKNDFENTINNPNKNIVNLSGPRFGYTYSFGKDADILRAAELDGGFEAYPAMFQFGYQFEKQYLNEGNFQALFEFIPMITGIDQQMFIPSLTFLNGFRNNNSGWEIAIGPSISTTTKLKGADYNGKFYSESDLDALGIKNLEIKNRLDSRGNFALTSALVIALGKTIKSGKMNIPLNFYATIPTKDGFRIGLSVGYNSKRR